jgi:DNA-binding response OmpR family regulator
MTPNWIGAERMEGLAGAHSVGHEERILLIENDSAVAEMYALGLNLSGYAVRIAPSLDSAWREVNLPDHLPQLIVLDIELRSMSGLDALNDLRRAPGTSVVPVIVLADDEDDFSEAYRRGATECHPRYRETPKQL